MKLYHGSLEIIQKPEIREANRSLDYGDGFYTTSSFQQAEDWVRRRMREHASGIGYVNTFEFDIRALKFLRCLLFESPNEEWVDFVMSNRTDRQFSHSYDIVFGPVANDRVYASFSLFEGGFINKQTLIAELKTYRLVDQYLFHTQDALRYLSFVEAKEIR